MKSTDLSIHDRLDLIEDTINAGSGIAGGIAGLIDKLKHHVPTPAPNAPHADSDTLSFTAFQNAMTQQAKDFGAAIDELRERLTTVENNIAAITKLLESAAQPSE